jgi:hypothetical protein
MKINKKNIPIENLLNYLVNTISLHLLVHTGTQEKDKYPYSIKESKKEILRYNNPYMSKLTIDS